MGLRQDYQRHSRRVTSTKRWKQLRLSILERDGWRCVKCGDLKCLEVDHIQPVRDAPDLSFDSRNLQTLCRFCHAHKTRAEVGFRPISTERQEWRKLMKENLDA